MAAVLAAGTGTPLASFCSGPVFAQEPSDAIDFQSTFADGATTSTLQRPRSPIESLLPALRFRRDLDRALATVQSALQPSATRAEQNQALEVLSELILPSPQTNYTLTSSLSVVPTAPGRLYLDAYRQARDKLSVLEQPGAWLIQSGEIGAWRRLKRQERTRESVDPVRAALNAYTNDLSFRTDSYVFNESKELKSKLIREDRLPDVKQVITSDLGLR